VARIDSYLTEVLGNLDVPVPANLREAMQYAVLGGGKRLRPLLAWYSCMAVGAPGEHSLAVGAALELIHAFSLVHDDLPALDNDDLRRGKPTLHKHAGEAMAVLAGDALLNSAYQVLSKRAPASVRAELVTLLATATAQMISGQVRDTLGGFEVATTPLEQVRLVHSEKTEALIAASCLMGLECGQAWWMENGRRGIEPRSTRKNLTDYGRSIGLMFQVVDDLIDVEQTHEQVGKRTGKDAAAGKLTYPGVLGVEASRREVERLRTQALSAIEPLGRPAQWLRDLCEYLCVRTQ
jgi:geranylgeranyl diphosphate synthase type II